jgi:hypothetical protein
MNNLWQSSMPGVHAMMTLNNLNGGKKFTHRSAPGRTLLTEVRKSPGQNAEHHDNNTNGPDNDDQGNFAAQTATSFCFDCYDAQQDE